MASQMDISNFCCRLTRVHRHRNETNRLRLESELQSWRRNLPAQYHDIDQSYPLNLARDTRKLWLFCQYHEASLYMHSGHPDDAATHIGSNHNHTSPSVKTVLEAASVLPPDAVLSHRQVYLLCTISMPGVANNMTFLIVRFMNWYLWQLIFVSSRYSVILMVLLNPICRVLG